VPVIFTEKVFSDVLPIYIVAIPGASSLLIRGKLPGFLLLMAGVMAPITKGVLGCPGRAGENDVLRPEEPVHTIDTEGSSTCWKHLSGPPIIRGSPHTCRSSKYLYPEPVLSKRILSVALIS
jgi:hypothetical protein